MAADLGRHYPIRLLKTDLLTTTPALSAPPLPRARQQSRLKAGALTGSYVLLGLALFLLTMVPRLVGLEQHLTADDQDWIRRTARFALAVKRGDPAGTYQSSHPAVPVLWIGSLAVGPERSAELVARARDLTQLRKTPSYLPAIFDARRALALTSAGLTVLLAWLVWRLFGTAPALLAGLLLAGEPFLVAHARLLHADPLLAQLMGVSVLAALVYFQGRGGRGFVAVSGLAAGLAVLAKAPGIFLFGFVPLLGLVCSWRRARRVSSSELRPLIASLALWGALVGLTALLVWPALLSDPLDTLRRLATSLRGAAEGSRLWGNFFLGRVYRDGDVGPLFYPLVTLLRLSPITFVGVVLLAWLGWRSRLAEARQMTGRSDWQWSLAALVAYLGLFTLMMTLSPRKVDRFLLPVYPILVILGALGLVLAVRRWLWPRLYLPALLALGLGQAAVVAIVQPYPLSFFNPLLGGTTVANQTVVVGWGEGMDQVAEYLESQPEPSGIVVSSLYHDLIDPQFAGTGVPLDQWQQAGYLADYVNMDQRQLVPLPLQGLVQSEAPVLTVRINGLDYVRLYRIPPELKAQRGPSGAPQKTGPPVR